jgi:hypothetical protein
MPCRVTKQLVAEASMPSCVNPPPPQDNQKGGVTAGLQVDRPLGGLGVAGRRYGGFLGTDGKKVGSCIRSRLRLAISACLFLFTRCR